MIRVNWWEKINCSYRRFNEYNNWIKILDCDDIDGGHVDSVHDG